MRASLCTSMLFLVLVVLTACESGPTVSAVVVDAVVSTECIDAEPCTPPEAISVGHCGTDANVRDAENGGDAYAITSERAEDIEAIVSVGHGAGDRPADAANGGDRRGFLVLTGEKAAVELFYRPNEALYAMGADGEPTDVREDLLVRRDGDVLEFTYESDTVIVTEVHTIAEVSTRPLELIAPDDFRASCCASTSGGVLAAWTAFALLPALRRSRRR